MAGYWQTIVDQCATAATPLLGPRMASRALTAGAAAFARQDWRFSRTPYDPRVRECEQGRKYVCGTVGLEPRVPPPPHASSYTYKVHRKEKIIV